jgi:hypothetical protein
MVYPETVAIHESNPVLVRTSTKGGEPENSANDFCSHLESALLTPASLVAAIPSSVHDSGGHRAF